MESFVTEAEEFAVAGIDRALRVSGHDRRTCSGYGHYVKVEKPTAIIFSPNAAARRQISIEGRSRGLDPAMFTACP